MSFRFVGLLALTLLVAAAPARAADSPPVAPTVADGAVVWAPDAPVSDAALLISGPDGVEFRRAFAGGERITLDPAALDAPLADGVYLYELRLSTVNAEGEHSRSGQTGAFEVRDGAPVQSPMMAQVIATDLIVQGSECVGIDCASSEAFGFDTVRLKENNLRIAFDDTSASASFPSNDWEITINDSDNGGASYFGITDRTAGRRIVTFEAGAPSNAMVLDDAGNLGLGTATPVLEIHSVNGDTPTLRLEQNGASGWTPQSWDLAGNETNFFVRDVTNGSQLPFKIRPNAGTDRLVLTPTGVAVGKANPASGIQLDVAGAVAVAGTFAMSNSYARGTPTLSITEASDGTELFKALSNGNLIISGTLTSGSDVNIKENILPVDPESVLEGVVGMPMATWQYIADEGSAVHLGPMAQDFHAAFGLGLNDTSISMVDADGVALASVQALHARSEADRAEAAALRAEVSTLRAENDALGARLARIEALIGGTNE